MCGNFCQIMFWKCLCAWGLPERLPWKRKAFWYLRSWTNIEKSPKAAPKLGPWPEADDPKPSSSALFLSFLPPPILLALLYPGGTIQDAQVFVHMVPCAFSHLHLSSPDAVPFSPGSLSPPHSRLSVSSAFPEHPGLTSAATLAILCLSIYTFLSWHDQWSSSRTMWVRKGKE